MVLRPHISSYFSNRPRGHILQRQPRFLQSVAPSSQQRNFLIDKPLGGKADVADLSGRFINLKRTESYSGQPACCSGVRYHRLARSANVRNCWITKLRGILRRPAVDRFSSAVSSASCILLPRSIKSVIKAAPPVVVPSAKIPAPTNAGSSADRGPLRITGRSSLDVNGAVKSTNESAYFFKGQYTSPFVMPIICRPAITYAARAIVPDFEFGVEQLVGLLQVPLIPPKPTALLPTSSPARASPSS